MAYQKKLEGVEVTEGLLSLWRDCYSHVQVNKAYEQSTSESTNERGQYTKKEASRVLKENHHPNQSPKFIPICVLRALEVLVQDSDVLERELQSTSLFFTPPPPKEEVSEERRKFLQRMERLKLQNEESEYVRLTNNIQKEPQDDITAKSMTYAASVGLNMVIAPLSFGCFMYFFAGGLFDYFLGENFSSRTTGGTDIKRVIVGVVSGVVMLFIEMILFVIRTHEVEAHAAKKKKKKKRVQPFSVYTKKGNRQTMPMDPRSQVLFKKQE